MVRACLLLLVACQPTGGGSVPVAPTGATTTGTTTTTPSTTSSSTGLPFPTELVDIDNYERLMEERLFTHLGDDRGFGPEHDLAREAIVEELEAAGLTVTLEPFTWQTETWHNVVAVQPGTSAGPGIVVGAHFDSVSNPGADDNATGTALVLETARVLAQYELETTITWVLFDREEQGLVGSRAFAAAHQDEIAFALTADMIGQDHGSGRVDLFATNASRALVDAFADDGIGPYGGGLGANRITGQGYGFSDHQAFEERGLPAFVIIEADYAANGNYHQPSDAADLSTGYIDYPYVDGILRSVVGFLADRAGLAP